MTEREKLAIKSAQALDKFVAQNPAFTINEDQPAYRGGTNLITIGQRRDENGKRQPIIFKYLSRIIYRNNFLTNPAQAASVTNPTTTLAEIKTAANAIIPGATIRRHLLWRYTLVWTK